MNDLEFEARHRTFQFPQIWRLSYDNVYLYLIEEFYGGPTEFERAGKKIKVRTIEGELIKTSDGRSHKKLSYHEKITPKKLIEYYELYYK